MWRYDMSYHERDETIFKLLEKERKELEAERPGYEVEQEELIITLQWWRVSSTKSNTIVGYLFNHPRRKEDKYKVGNCCCVVLDPEYDVSCLKEGSLALTLKNCRGKQSVYRLGIQKEQKPQRKDWGSRDK